MIIKRYLGPLLQDKYNYAWAIAHEQLIHILEMALYSQVKINRCIEFPMKFYYQFRYIKNPCFSSQTRYVQTYLSKLIFYLQLYVRTS